MNLYIQCCRLAADIIVTRLVTDDAYFECSLPQLRLYRLLLVSALCMSTAHHLRFWCWVTRGHTITATLNAEPGPYTGSYSQPHVPDFWGRHVHDERRLYCLLQP